MGKKEKHKKELVKLFNDFFKSSDEKEIINYLIVNSNLPGRRANLELANAFGDTIENYCFKQNEILFNLCKEMIKISLKDAETNNPKEFIPFCGVIGIGVISAVIPKYLEEGLDILQESSQDERWRMREAVAMAIQRLIKNKPLKILEELQKWIKKDNFFNMRAVVAGIAEPALLKNKQVADLALNLHKKVINKVVESTERKSESFKKLRQGLGYTLSVVVAEIPEEGFNYINQITELNDKDVTWIIKSNLKKSRLVKKFPKKVKEIELLLK